MGKTRLTLLTALGLTVLCGAATAQTITCQTIGIQTVCRQSGLSDPYAGQAAEAQRAFLQAQRAQAERAQAQAAAIAAARAQQQAQTEADAERARSVNADQQRQFRAQNAGRLVASGKCDEAKAYALSEGDFTLANQVVQACSSTSAAPRQ